MNSPVSICAPGQAPSAIRLILAVGPLLAIGITTLALSVAVVPVAAFAQDAQPDTVAGSGDADEAPFSIYADLLAGVSFVDNVDLSGPAGLAAEPDYGTGFTVGGAIGARFLEHFRAELQITHNQSRIDELRALNSAERGRGDLAMLAIMANGYFDYDFGVGVIPYVGAGLGWGLVEFKGRNNPGTAQLEINDTDGVFVWNVAAGVTVPFSQTVDLNFGYRYIASEDDISFKARVGTSPTRVDMDDAWSAHQLVAGIRLNF